MGSKGGKAKQQIAAYQMSLHLGFCYSVDKLLELFVKEKSVWKGSQSTNTELTIDQKNLFGGPKKEGGLLGAVSILQGRSDQVLPTHLATRLGRTPSNSPGFRDILSLFFYGAPGQGFLWSHNYPYLHTVWAKVQRIFQSGWYSDKAALVNPGSSPAYDSVTLNPSRDFDAQNAAVYPESSVDAYTVSGFSPDDILRVSITQGTFRAWSRWSGYGSDPGEYRGSTGDPLWWCAVKIKTAEGAITQHFDISGMTEEEAFALNSSTVVELTGSTAYTLWLSDDILYNRGGLSLKVEQLRYYDGDRDMNPAHIIRECLTNTEWGMALPGSAIDDTSFTDAANVLYDEGFGLSLTWSGQSDVETFVNEILGHIDATYGTDPETGKFFIKLIRGGYGVGVLPELTEDNCRIIQFNRKGMGETTNEVVVTWTNPANEGEETVTVHDLANYSAQGVLISSSRNYYGIRSASLAIRVALRELNKASQPLATFEVEANRVAWRWKSGDVIKVTYPEYGLNGLPCRITNINYGKPGTMGIRITLIEDVFDMPSDSYVVSDGSYWEPPVIPLPMVDAVAVITAPYFALARSLGDESASTVAYPAAFGMALVSATGNVAERYAQTSDAAGNLSYAYKGDVDVSARAVLDSALTPGVLSVVSVSGLTGNLSPAPGLFVIVGPSPSVGEIGIIESVAGGTFALRRGMLDTIPATWPAGTPIWLFDWNSDMSDDESHIVGESSAYRIAPQGSSGTGYISTSVTYDGRPFKPFRPANLRVNGTLFAEAIIGPPVVSWSHRNRLMETSVPLTWDAGSVTPEAGTAYNGRTYDESGALIEEQLGLSGASYSPEVLNPITWGCHFSAAGFVDVMGGTIEVNGAVAIVADAHAFDGYSASFTGGYLLVPNTTAVQFGSGDFTIDGFFELTSLTMLQGLFDKRSELKARGIAAFFDNTDSRVKVCFGDSSTAAWEVQLATAVVSAGVRYHLRIVRSGTTYYVFLNGDLSGSTSWAGTIADDDSNILLGTAYLSYFLVGKLSDWYITKTAVDTGPFTPRTTPFTLGGAFYPRMRVEIEALRDGFTCHTPSVQEFDIAGYGTHYGKYYGGI